MSILSRKGLSVARDGYTADFSAFLPEVGKQFTSRSGAELTELIDNEKGSSLLVADGSIGKLARDFSGSVLNAEGLPAKPGETFYFGMMIESHDSVLTPVELGGDSSPKPTRGRSRKVRS